MRARLGGRGDHACANDAAASSVSPSAGSSAASPEAVKAIETILGLRNVWDGKVAESLVAPGFDVARMKRQVGAASAWGACKMGEAVAGDGNRESTVKLSCDGGTLSMGVSLDPNTRRLTNLELVPTRDQRCVP